jgi:hypothetical protein
LHDKTKHIDAQCHFIRDQGKKERIELKFVSSKDQTTNIMTKLLRMVQFEETPSPAQLQEFYMLHYVNSCSIFE